jgi:hypothetical protein
MTGASHSGTTPHFAPAEGPVDELDLSEDDLRRVLAACQPLRVGTPAPAYLKEFVARRLEEASAAALAARVRQFSDGQMEAVWEEVRRRQEGEE